MNENNFGVNETKRYTVISGQSADERLMAADKMTPNRTISTGLENNRLNNTSETNRTNPLTNTSDSIAFPLSTTTLSYISMSSTSTTASPVTNTTLAEETREPPLFGWGDNCYSTPDDYELIPSVICSTLVVLGVVYLLYGYRCFKAVLFLTGFAFGTTIIYLICTVEKLMPMYGNVSVSVLAGLLFGLITVLVVYVGLFMLGFHLGLLSTCATLIVIYLLTPYVDQLEPPNSVWLLFVIFMSMGLTGACATLYFHKGRSSHTIDRCPLHGIPSSPSLTARYPFSQSIDRSIEANYRQSIRVLFFGKTFLYFFLGLSFVRLFATIAQNSVTIVSSSLLMRFSSSIL